METLQEYVLIDQYRPHIERYEKQSENQWIFTEYSGIDTSFALSSAPVEIEMSDLYEAVEFEQPPEN